MSISILEQTDRFEIFQASYRAGVQMDPHVDGAFRISVVERGEVQEVHRGTAEEASALSVVTKPPGARHRNRFSPSGACMTSVVVPVESLAGPDRDLNRLCQWNWTHRGPATAAAGERTSTRPAGAAKRISARAT